MSAATCPDPAQLQELVIGSLAEGEEARLSAHLDSCPACRQKLETLAGEEFRLLMQDAQESGSSTEAGPALAAVMDQLERSSSISDSCLAVADASSSTIEIQSFLAPSAQPGHLGRLGQYEVLSVVGRGGMGIVLKARDEVLGRVVAIKVMAPHLAASATARRRFLREARAAAAVRDEHVIDIHAVLEENNLTYMVMEYINGVTLQQRLNRQGPIAVREVLRIGMQSAKGLAAAHAQGLVHRDIKPANILLENGVERVKIGDFGLARAADDASLTQSGVVAGTPEYMAPEQAYGESVDSRADLFSLGSVLYAMCAGRPPFRAKGALAILKRVCEDTPRPLREINPDLPEWLCQLISKLHAKKPADRFASAGEVADLLRCGLSGSSPNVPFPGTVELQSSSPSPPPRKRRSRWLAGAVIVLLLAAALGLTETTGVTNLRGAIFRMFASDSSRAGRPSKNIEHLTEAERWERSVAELPPEKQVEAVVQQLKQWNPKFNGKVESKITNGAVTELRFLTDEVADISPLRALKELESLHCPGTYPVRGKLADLTPLRGLRLKCLEISNTEVTDLRPLQGMPLTTLNCGLTDVADLSPLKGMRLDLLTIQSTKVADLKPLHGMPLSWLDLAVSQRVSDLKPLQGMPLKYLNLSSLMITNLSLLTSITSLEFLYLDDMPTIDLTPLRDLHLNTLSIRGTQITDLTPIKKLPLKHLRLDYRPDREAFVRSLAGLESINDKPAAEFWKSESKK